MPGDTLRLEITMEKLGSRFGKGRGVASVDGEVACEGAPDLHHPAGRGPAMTRIAVLSDVHGNLVALEAVLKQLKREKPDFVLVAGDLVLNGPDPNGTIDALRGLEKDGGIIVSGNTDIAVGDFDYGAAFPHYQDGVPDTITEAAEWAHDELGDDQLDWLRRLPAERRILAGDDQLVLVVHASPGSQTQRLRPGARRERHLRARRRDRRPGDLRGPHPPARGPRPGLEGHRQRRLRGLRVRRRADRLVGDGHDRRRRGRRPRSGAPSSTCCRSRTRSASAACRVTSTARPPSAPGSSSDDLAVAGQAAPRRRHGHGRDHRARPGRGAQLGRPDRGALRHRPDRGVRHHDRRRRRSPARSRTSTRRRSWTARTCGGPTGTSSSGWSRRARRWTRPGSPAGSTAPWRSTPA